MCPSCHRSYLFSDSGRLCGKCQRKSLRRRRYTALVRGEIDRFRDLDPHSIKPGEFDGL